MVPYTILWASMGGIWWDLVGSGGINNGGVRVLYFVPFVLCVLLAFA